MAEQKFTTLKSTKWKELKLTKDEWDRGYPFKVEWIEATGNTYVYNKKGESLGIFSGFWNIRFYTEVVAPIVPPKVIEEETIAFWMGKGYNWDEATRISTWVKLNKMTPSPETIKEIIKVVYVYKVLPKPPTALRKENYDLYEELDKTLAAKDVSGVLGVLRKMLVRENSPAAVLAIVLAVTGITALITGIIGTYNFAPFMMEEALQTIDMAIYQSSKDKNWDLMAKALAKKKELLHKTWLEELQAKTPFLNVWAAQQKFFEASQIKYETDVESLKRKELSTWVNPDVDLDKVVAAIERGEDPTPYLPSTQPVIIPEIISGEVTGVIDGDTIDVKDMRGYTYRVRLIGIDAPEFKTTEGKASAKFLTDQIHGKRVNVKVDPNNQKDEYDRVLGVVFKDDVDINRRILQEGYAGYYFIGSSKYYSDDDYREATKRRGKVSITSKPTYCKIYLDQNDTLKLTTETLELTEGAYLIGVTKEGYVAKSELVTIIPAKTIEVRFELEKTGLVPVPVEEVPIVPPVEVPPEVPAVVKPKVYVAKGKYGFSVDTTPDLALVYYNNRKRKYAADRTYITATQSGTVVVRMEGYEDVTFEISLIEKDVKFYKVDLTTGTWEEVRV